MKIRHYVRTGLAHLFVLFFCSTTASAGIGPYDYGDDRSETLTKKAWDALNVEDYKATLAYTKRCITLYGSRAIVQQNLLKEYPSGDDSLQYWALNDVGACYYIMGEAYFAKKKYKRAERAYRKVIKKFYYAQYYNPAGFFIKVTDDCKKKLVAIEAILGEGKGPSRESRPKRIDIREELKKFDKEKQKMR